MSDISQRKNKKWLPIVAAVMILLLVCGAWALSQLGQNTQSELVPVIGIAWSNDSQEYSWQRTVIAAAGGKVVELPEVKNANLTYEVSGRLSSQWLEDSGALQMAAAGTVRELDYTDTNAEAALSGIDGVYFFGGEDISPSLYKNPQAAANHGEEFNPARDVSDFILMSYCIEHDIPVLGTCRGMQMLAVAAGCELVQDIPDYFASLGLQDKNYHRLVAGDDVGFAYHAVSITDRDSLMYAIVGAACLPRVSSWHHQALVSTEGTNLQVTALADDGGVSIIEAIELPQNKFCLGVGFHPDEECGEVLNDGVPKEDVCSYDTSLKFFQRLVEYAAVN